MLRRNKMPFDGTELGTFENHPLAKLGAALLMVSATFSGAVVRLFTTATT